MERTIEIETSYYDPDPKRWSFGCDGYVKDVKIEYPPELDELENEELLELVENADGRVNYINT